MEMIFVDDDAGDVGNCNDDDDDDDGATLARLSSFHSISRFASTEGKRHFQ